MTVADVVADGLVRAGVSRLFAARDAGGVREALARREVPSTAVGGASVACVMAAVWGGLACAPGAVALGAEPAVALAGLDHALTHRLPLIALTSGPPGPHPSDLARVTKATLTVTAGSAAHWIAHACQLAMKEPWGPVHLDVPRDIGVAASLPVATSCRPAPLPAPDPGALENAVRLIEGAERPLVIVGRLCRSDADAAWIRAFAEARPAPVLVTDGGRGTLPDPHPLVIGTLGGGEPEREMLESADLIVAIAVDRLELSGMALPPGTVVLELTPVVPDAGSYEPSAVVGDVGSILEELAPRLRDRRYAEWDVARLHALKQAAALPRPGQGRRAQRVVDAVRRLTPAGTIAVFDGAGPARAWQAVASGECLIMSGAHATAFAVASAAAARLARGNRPVVCFVDSPDREALDPVTALGVPVLIVSHGGAAPVDAAFPPAMRVFPSVPMAALPAAIDTALASAGPVLISVPASEE
jgi:acetolactate synthase-1/2/3 large subunit